MKKIRYHLVTHNYIYGYLQQRWSGEAQRISRYISACHTDIFPWATNAFSTLSANLQREFKEENQKFLRWFLSRDQVTSLVILGNSTRKEIEGVLGFNALHKEIPNIMQPPTFEYGTFEIDGIRKSYFYSSKGPSARGSDAEKYEVHNLFGDFIRSTKNS
jgi:hypothetical protein